MKTPPVRWRARGALLSQSFFLLFANQVKTTTASKRPTTTNPSMKWLLLILI